MTAETLRQVFDQILPADVIREAVVRLGVQKRRRELDPVALIYSLVLVGGTWEAGRIATAVRDYFERGGTRVGASAYYKWFDAELLALVQELSKIALAYADGMPKHLPGILAGRTDWLAVDSTTVKLRPELAMVWPGCGPYAALKVHKTYSLGAENVVAYTLTPARKHDGPELRLDESWRGKGLVADLGYASFDLIRQCQALDVHFVIRRPQKWAVFLDESKGNEARSGWVGVDQAKLALTGDILPDERGIVDVDVTLGSESNPIPVRLVGIRTETEFLYFFTNLPRSTHPAAAVGMVYRLRWSIEIDNKLTKTGCQLDEITAERPVSAEILAHVAMIASILANALVHADHVERGAVGTKIVKFDRPTLHPILLWKTLVAGSHRISEMLADPSTPVDEWARLAAHLTAGAGDRNWKKSPSPMDRVKGRGAAPRAWAGGRSRISADARLK